MSKKIDSVLSKCDDLISKLTKLKKALHEDDEDVEKSNYGPKGSGLYSDADNARRKMNNVGASVDQGPNVNVKSYSTRPGQLSAKQQAARAPSGPAGPVKRYTPEQIAAINEARKLVGDKLKRSVPEQQKLQKMEDVMATQLANMMAGRAMLGNPPRQPTDQEMFGHLVPSEEAIKAEEQNWNNTHSNWIREATKPISERFSTQEEEEAYWASIKVSDRDDGKPGY